MDPLRIRFRILIALTLITIGIGTVAMHFLEGFSWLDACYFSVVTLATVGFGDLVPHTPAGKLFTIGYIIMGVGIITSFINFRVKYRVQNYQKKHQGPMSED